MNLSARVSKLEAAAPDGAPLIIWANGKTPEQVEVEIAQRMGSVRRPVLLCGWTAPSAEMAAVLPAGSVAIATGVPRATPNNC